MNNTFTKNICPLCDNETKSKETDSGNSEVHICTNSQCGDTEITISAVAHITDNGILKDSLQQSAKKAKSDGYILYLYKDKNNQLQQKYISKD